MTLSYLELLYEANRFKKTQVPNKFLISLVPVAARVYYNCAYELYTRANIEILHILEPKQLQYRTSDVDSMEIRLLQILDDNQKTFQDIVNFVKSVPEQMLANRIEIPEYSDGHRELMEFNEKRKELEEKLKRTTGAVNIPSPIVQQYVNAGLFKFAILRPKSIHELYHFEFIDEDDPSNKWRSRVINNYFDSLQSFLESGASVYDRQTKNDSLVAMSTFITEQRSARNVTEEHLTVLLSLANYIENPMDERAERHVRKFIENILSRLVAYYANGGTHVTPPVIFDLPPTHPLKIITTLMQYGPLLKFLFQE